MPVHSRFFLAPGNRINPHLLARSGPVLQVEVSVPTALSKFLASKERPVPQPLTGWALIDTGATRSCADATVLTKLGLSPIGVVEAGTAGGKIRQYLYPAKLRFPGEGLEIEFTSLIGVDLRGQKIADRELIVLLGRDVLSRCVLVYNGPGGFFTVAF